ncbi:GntR family transcriptional regulator [Thalassococcus lentus]|uniref:GntR family transcriptional regulator n=1 Tax=Thalassococcus lentus TaxID=1210524 RepID=A0ABT4XVH3_9RHOB|nr:GntR family transcriptional regulator [Thalassococcus lentus]MDA7425970.1 GntR family transcriptional regulator [Thalassococcus lentus]
MANQTTYVIETIIQRIDQGTYLPGQVLDETGIAEELGVSRTPVREAFIRLESDGLILRGGRRGAKLFKPDTNEFLQILELHATLEAQAAELAARRATDETAARLDENIKASERHLAAHGDAAHREYYQLNLQFHEIIIDAAANPYLSEMIKLTARKLMAYYRNRYAFKGATAASVSEHKTISAYIKSKDALAARGAMKQHFEYGLDTVMDLLAAAN